MGCFLLYPKICPPIFFKDLQRACFKISPRVAQFKGLLTVKNWGFGSDKENEVSKGLSKSHMPTNMVKHPHTKFQYLQHKIAQSKTLIALQSTAGAKWSFDSQKFKFLVNISF